MDRFFISYNREDRSWAEWIGWQLTEAGCDVFIQAWDIRPGNNFVLAMQKATETCNRTIAVLSSHYIVAKYTQPEWATAFNQDPTGEMRLLLPVRVEEVELSRLWLSIVYIDLVGLDEEDAKQALLEGISFDNRLPTLKPNFPSKKSEITKFDSTYPLKGPIKKDPLKEWTVLSFKIREENGEDVLQSFIRKQNSRVVEANTRNHVIYSNASLLSNNDQEGGKNDKAFYLARYEIIFPLSYRGKLLISQKIYLKLDISTLAIPWESIIASGLLNKHKIIPDNLNIIRQLSLPYTMTNQSNEIQEDYALVIGGAKVPNLPTNHSSAKEGRAISNLLSSFGYPVITEVFSKGDIIISSLFNQRYKIIHISGTGYYDSNKSVMGILIGENLIISPKEISQLASVPDLIFINFGTQQIANSSSHRENESSDFDYCTLAAKIATELIQSGIECVIVSSMPIDEISNFTFSVEFYKAFLKGEKFSDAVRKARIKSLEDARDVRNFGQFQCYGNVDFILSKAQNASSDDTSNNLNILE